MFAIGKNCGFTGWPYRMNMLFQDTAFPRGSHVMAKNKLLLDVTRGLNSFELGEMSLLHISSQGITCNRKIKLS